jgi:2'-5' RNA ligase
MPSPVLWRTFVAFPVAAATRRALAGEASRLARLDPRLRVVPTENLHLTVAFLGPTSPEEVPALARAIGEAAAGAAPIEVRVSGLGAFPRVAAPRVVWAGLVETREAGRLEALVSRCRALLEAAGHASDDGDRFHAHVTLARLEARPSRGLEKALTEGHLQGTYEPEFLSDLHLMISEPGPDHRTRYRPLATASLNPVA